jgi:hypothetical protein
MHDRLERQMIGQRLADGRLLRRQGEEASPSEASVRACRSASLSSMSPSNSSSCSISRSSFSDDRPKRARRKIDSCKIDSCIRSFSISNVLA